MKQTSLQKILQINSVQIFRDIVSAVKSVILLNIKSLLSLNYAIQRWIMDMDEPIFGRLLFESTCIAFKEDI